MIMDIKEFKPQEMQEIFDSSPFFGVRKLYDKVEQLKLYEEVKARLYQASVRLQRELIKQKRQDLIQEILDSKD